MAAMGHKQKLYREPGELLLSANTGSSSHYSEPRHYLLVVLSKRENHAYQYDNENAADSVEQRVWYWAISFSISCESEPLNYANPYQRCSDQNGLADRRLSIIVDASHQ